MSGHDGERRRQLLEAAYRQALAGFHDEVAHGRRNPVAEVAEYRRRRRDYATALRIENVPHEAKTLARRLRETHNLALDEEGVAEFDGQVTQMLVRLYDAFIAAAENTRQGNR